MGWSSNEYYIYIYTVSQNSFQGSPVFLQPHLKGNLNVYKKNQMNYSYMYRITRSTTTTTTKQLLVNRFLSVFDKNSTFEMKRRLTSPLLSLFIALSFILCDVIFWNHLLTSLTLITTSSVSESCLLTSKIAW